MVNWVDTMSCPWCGGENIFNNTHEVCTAPYMVTELNGAKITVLTVTFFSTCLDCGLIFQEHRQSDEWYNWFYSSGTYRQTLGISQEEMDADEQRRAMNLLLFLSQYNLDIKRHCDIGSSRGYFLDEMKRKYNTVDCGVDLNVSYQSVETSGLFGDADLVSAIHVLEHVTDPIKELTTWASMTSKYILIEVPGLNTTGGPLRFAHLYYFQPELLKAKIIELGFDIVAMETEPNTRILAEKRLTNNK